MASMTSQEVDERSGPRNDVAETTLEQRQAYGECHLPDFEAVIFPAVVAGATLEARCSVAREIVDAPYREGERLLHSAVCAAWAIVQARHTGSTDVIFATTLAESTDSASTTLSRSAQVFPVGVRVSWDRTVEDLLRQLEQQAGRAYGLEPSILPTIETPQSCRSQTLLSVQTQPPRPAVGSTGDGVSMELDRLTAMQGKHAVALCVKVQPADEGLTVTLDYASAVLDAPQAERLMLQFETVLRQVRGLKGRTLVLDSVQTTSERDLLDLWAWNPLIPEPPSISLTYLLSRTAQSSWDSIAVDAWDGKLTYGELESISTAIARELVGRGLSASTIVPLLFDKTLWSTVALLAAIKAGVAATLLPASHPEGRLKKMLDQIKPELVLTSRSARQLGERITNAEVLTVDSESTRTIIQMCNLQHNPPPKIDPARPLCVLFTSGSTGTPKAAVLTHRNIVAALSYQKDSHQLHPCSRVLDLAPNAGDAIWMNTLVTLSHGACLCVPSDSARLGTDMRSISRFKPSWALVSPTMADVLYHLDLRNLKSLVLAGEPVSSTHITPWSKRGVQVLNCYGPAECTPFIAMKDVTKHTGGVVSIGKPIGCCAWVADPETGNSLVGIGMVGELWLESPLVGEGYLNDPMRTEAAFVSDPAWLTEGVSGSEGRHGRLYKTGDLARYSSDGTLVILGRKESAITIRGQRLDLGEVEHALKVELGVSRTLQVAVEIVIPAGRSRQRLVGFVTIALLDQYSESTSQACIKAPSERIRYRLSQLLPSHMVPTDILPIASIPTTATTKVDRRSLKKLGETMLAVPSAKFNATCVVPTASRVEGQKPASVVS